MIEQPQIFTFYSFKGGVGRTMALLNIAYGLVAKGRNVLVVDMDLEAPGLSGFMNRGKEIPHFPRHDMLDLLQWAKSTAVQVTEDSPLDPSSLPPLSDYVVSVLPEKLANLPHKHCELGRLDVLPVEVDREFYDRLPSVGVTNMNRETLLRVGSLLNAWFTSRRFAVDIPDYYGPVREEERTALYDYVLIDSRTGSTEVGGLCIGPLSDQLVILCGLNDQNIEDTRHFLIEVGLLTSPSEFSPELSKPSLFVASPVPTGELLLKTVRLARLTKALGKPAVELTYHPQMALMETIFVRDYSEDDLTRRYQKLLDQILDRAGDRVDFDPMLLKALAEQEPFSSAIKASLRDLLRSASVTQQSSMLFLAINQIQLDSIAENDDFQLFDRICRALAEDDTSFEFSVLARWADVLKRWQECSSDSELAVKRISAAIDCVNRIVNSARASSNWRAQALLNRGVLFGKQGQIENEIADYTAVLEMPGLPADHVARALFNRGVVFGQLNDVDREIADFTSVIGLVNVPKLYLADAQLARGLAFLKRIALDRAIEDFTAVVELVGGTEKQSAEALFFRGVTFGELGEVDRELADYSAVIKMVNAPKNLKADSLNRRGWNSLMADQRDEAIVDLREAASLADKSANILGNLGVAFLVSGDVDAAMATFDAAMEVATPDELVAIEKDLDDVIVKYGTLPGADEVRSRIKANCANAKH